MTMHDGTAFGLLAAMLIVASVTDVRSGKVYNWLTLPAAGIGIGLAVAFGVYHAGLEGALDGLRDSVLAMVAGLLILGLVCGAGGMGWGDVKLLGAFGAISASWQCVVSAMIYSFVIAALMALVVMIRHGLVKRTFARLFGAAMLASAKVKPEIPDDSPRIPYALALAVGGLIAAAEVLLGWHTPWAAGWQ